MSQVCDFCGKRPVTGNQVSHSNQKNRTRWIPNLKRMKAVVNGHTKTVRVCTGCIRSGKVVRPVRRSYKPEAGTVNTQ